MGPTDTRKHSRIKELGKGKAQPWIHCASVASIWSTSPCLELWSSNIETEIMRIEEKACYLCVRFN